MANLTPVEEINLLKEKLKKEQQINKELKAEIEILYFEIGRLNRNLVLEKFLNGAQSKTFAAVAGNWLMDTDPINLSCSGEKVDTSAIYTFRLLDVLAICSRRRPKDIYLRKSISPKSGGKEKNMITFDKNGVEFEAVLYLIQKKGAHLIRVQRSHAINIYHYTFNKENTFILNANFRTEANTNIHEIPTDAIFNK